MVLINLYSWISALLTCLQVLDKWTRNRSSVAQIFSIAYKFRLLFSVFQTVSNLLSSSVLGYSKSWCHISCYLPAKLLWSCCLALWSCVVKVKRKHTHTEEGTHTRSYYNSWYIKGDQKLKVKKIFYHIIITVSVINIIDMHRNRVIDTWLMNFFLTFKNFELILDLKKSYKKCMENLCTPFTQFVKSCIPMV